MNVEQIQTRKMWLLALITIVVITVLLYADSAFAGATPTIGEVAKKITDSMSNFAKLITAASYVSGFGFAVGSILKFKAHKDNPTQIPVGTPIALFFIAIALVFLPTVMSGIGVTAFGAGAQTGGVAGVDKLGS
ncbi:type IVB secretion system protein IcmD/DotP [soil metagenome]